MTGTTTSEKVTPRTRRARETYLRSRDTPSVLSALWTRVWGRDGRDGGERGDCTAVTGTVPTPAQWVVADMTVRVTEAVTEVHHRRDPPPTSVLTPSL